MSLSNSEETLHFNGYICWYVCELLVFLLTWLW